MASSVGRLVWRLWFGFYIFYVWLRGWHRRLVDWYGVFHAVHADEFLASLPRESGNWLCGRSVMQIWEHEMRCTLSVLGNTKHPLPKQSCSIAPRSCPCASQLRLQKLKVVQDYNILSVHHILRRYCRNLRFTITDLSCSSHSSSLITMSQGIKFFVGDGRRRRRRR